MRIVLYETCEDVPRGQRFVARAILSDGAFAPVSLNGGDPEALRKSFSTFMEGEIKRYASFRTKPQPASASVAPADENEMRTNALQPRHDGCIQPTEVDDLIG